MSRQNTNHAAVHAMVAEYQRNPSDIVLQSRIIEAFAPLTARLKRDLPRTADREEFEQDVATELLKAALKFEDSLFSSFAKFARTVAWRVKTRYLSDYYSKQKRRQVLSNTDNIDKHFGSTVDDDRLEAQEHASRREREILEVRAVLKQHLTDAEWRILTLSLDGRSNQQMAKQLKISVHTVDNLRSSIRAKVRDVFGESIHGTGSGDVGQAEEEGCCAGADALGD